MVKPGRRANDRSASSGDKGGALKGLSSACAVLQIKTTAKRLIAKARKHETEKENAKGEVEMRRDVGIGQESNW
jgi:hypothetical protein